MASEGTAPVDGEIVELRVHGVGGAPPSQLLGDPDPILVSGSVLAGFWRPERNIPWIAEAPWLSISQGEPQPDRDNRKYPVEAFCWGGLTSGDWSRSLWILLTPFALGNAAGWMHEPLSNNSDPGSDERARAPFQKLIATWFSFSLTVMVIWMFIYLALDLVGFRCGWMVSECRSNHGWLRGIVDWSHSAQQIGSVHLEGGIGRLMFLFTFVPLLVLGIIYLAGRASFRDYEMFRIAEESRSGVELANPPNHSSLGLRNPFFWQSDRPVQRLQRLHLATGIAATQVGLAGVMAHVTQGTPTATHFRVLLVFGLGIVGLNLVMASFSPLFLRGPREKGPADIAPTDSLLAAFAILALTLFVTWGAGTNTVLAEAQNCDTGITCFTYGGGPTPPISHLENLAYGLTGFQTTLVLLMLGRARGPRLQSRVTDVVLALLLAILVAGPVLHHGWERPWTWLTGLLPALDGWFARFTVWSAIGLLILTILSRQRFGVGKAFLGIGPSALSAIASFSLGSFWAGAGALIADTLDGGGTEFRLNPPKWFSWAATSFAALILLSAVALLLLLKTTKRKRADRSGIPTDHEAIANQFTSDGFATSAALDSERHATRAKRILNAHRWRRIVARADRSLALCQIVVLSLAVGQVVSFLIRGDTTSQQNPPWYLAISNTAVLALPVVAYLGMRLAFSSPSGRRGVGAVWDVVTFFPRTFHPFAPPCYAERAVPQLAFRLRNLTQGAASEPGPAVVTCRQGVVLRAHSQGTALAIASVLQYLGAARELQQERLRMITFGSPLTVLYARVFPSYFGGLVGLVGKDLSGSPKDMRWLHFRARTDPLGTKLFGYCDPTNPWLGPYAGAKDIAPIADPSRWARISGEEDPPMGGHSTYWKHPKVDATVALMAGLLARDRALIRWARGVVG